jgi:hypothetical protein
MSLRDAESTNEADESITTSSNINKITEMKPWLNTYEQLRKTRKGYNSRDVEQFCPPKCYTCIHTNTHHLLLVVNLDHK